MRMELICEAGPDGPEVFVYVDGRALARAEWIAGVGYHVKRDSIPPEMEAAVRALEDGPGSQSEELRPGQGFGLDVAPPTQSQVDEARRLPLYRPRPGYRAARVGGAT